LKAIGENAEKIADEFMKLKREIPL